MAAPPIESHQRMAPVPRRASASSPADLAVEGLGLARPDVGSSNLKAPIGERIAHEQCARGKGVNTYVISSRHAPIVRAVNVGVGSGRVDRVGQARGTMALLAPRY